MKRLLPAALLLCACTLIVDNELSSHTPPDAGSDAGPCGEPIFLDGTPDDGGAFFHSGVTGLQWHGPAFPIDGKEPSNYGSVIAFLRDGGLELAGGSHEDVGYLPLDNYTPSNVYVNAGHEGPGGFGCAEILAATYDPLHDKTSWLAVSGGCNDTDYDGGTTSGAPGTTGPALGWVTAPDGGGTVAAMYGGLAQSCDETFPLACIPPTQPMPATDARSVHGLIGPGGQPVWVVTLLPNGPTRLYASDFTVQATVLSWAGSVTGMAADVALAARIASGKLDAALFDAAATIRAQASIDLGDSGAHALQIARYGGTGTTAIATWLAGDGTARAGTLDVSTAGTIKLTGVKSLCGSSGASFVAPMCSAQAVVQIGDALYLRLLP